MTQNPPNPDVTFVEGEDQVVFDIAQLTPSEGDMLVFTGGAWVNKTVAQVKTLLGIS